MSRPLGVGILALEVYAPNQKVLQEDLEVQDGCTGKYTSGLGQVSMAFCTTREDVASMAMTAASSLLQKYEVDPRAIGRLEVGTESGLDRSKSVKSRLMRLLASHGNHDVEGVDSVHGCYGGTAALFNAAAWVESSSWDGRLALVVASDVALYAPGSPARATGGCGAVAMLVGPDAPLVLEPGWRATFADDTEEFCKPAGGWPYPVVDGPATLQQFLRAADHCYSSLHAKLTRQHQQHQHQQQQQQSGQMTTNAPSGTSTSTATMDLAQGLLGHVDFFVSHAPFNVLVRKTFARLYYHDLLRQQHHHQQQQQQPPLTAAAAAAAADLRHLQQEGTWVHSPLVTAPSPTCSAPAGPLEHSLEDMEHSVGCGASSSQPGSDVTRVKSENSSSTGATKTLAQGSAVAASHCRSTLQAGTSGCLRGAVQPWQCLPTQWSGLFPGNLPDNSREDKALSKTLVEASSVLYQQKAEPATSCQRRVGNIYTGCLYLGLADLWEQQGGALEGKRVLLFAFGSGVMASMFALVGRACPSCSKFTLQAVASKLGLRRSIDSRDVRTPQEFNDAAQQVADSHGQAPFQPAASIESLLPGTFYLASVDAGHRRVYETRAL